MDKAQGQQSSTANQPLSVEDRLGNVEGAVFEMNKSSQLVFWRLVAGIFGVILVGVAIFTAYLWGQRRGFEEVKEAEFPFSRTKVTPTPDPTKDWEVYQSEEFRFEIKHPSYLFPGENVAPSGLKQGVVSFESEEICDPDNPALYINYNNQIFTKGVLISSEVVELAGLQVDLDLTSLPANNYCALSKKVEGGEFLQATVSFEKDGVEWVMIFRLRTAHSDSDLILFKQMLSTFKFSPLVSSGQEASCGKMTLSEAREIVLESECGQEGGLTGEFSCNEVTNTWWLGLDIQREGCAPACVVDTAGKEGEINWRCTDLVPSPGSSCSTCGR